MGEVGSGILNWMFSRQRNGGVEGQLSTLNVQGSDDVG